MQLTDQQPSLPPAARSVEQCELPAAGCCAMQGCSQLASQGILYLLNVIHKANIIQHSRQKSFYLKQWTGNSCGTRCFQLSHNTACLRAILAIHCNLVRHLCFYQFSGRMLCVLPADDFWPDRPTNLHRFGFLNNWSSWHAGGVQQPLSFQLINPETRQHPHPGEHLLMPTPNFNFAIETKDSHMAGAARCINFTLLLLTLERHRILLSCLTVTHFSAGSILQAIEMPKKARVDASSPKSLKHACIC